MIFIIILFIISYCLGQEINIQPLPQPTNAMGSASLPDAVFFAGGGTQFSLATDVITIFDAKRNIWTNSTLSSARNTVSGTSLPDRGLVFFAGGQYADKTFSSTIDVINYYNNSMYQLNLSYPRYGIASTTLPDYGLVFFAGGYNFNNYFITTIDIYNIFTNTFTIANLSYPCDIVCSAVSLPSYGLAFFGGIFSIDIYNANYNSWSNFTLNPQRSFYSLNTLDSYGLGFVVGGINILGILQGEPLFDPLIAPSNNLDIYSVITNTWTKKYLTFSAMYISTISLNSKGLVFFGGGASFTSLQSNDIVNIYDANLDVIFEAKLYLGRTGMATASLDNYGYVFFAGGKIITGEKFSTIDVFGDCNPGTFNSTLTTSQKKCSSCLSGSYAYKSSLSCPICPPGTYCPVKETPAPIPSQAGCFNPNPGATTPCVITCSMSFFCPSGSSSLIPCPPGNYCGEPRMSSPTPCPKGTFNPLPGSIWLFSCNPCPQGSYCNSNQSATGYLPCPSGSFCPQGSVNLGQPCPAGFYCPFATNSLMVCPAGSYCQTSSSIPLLCPSGSYCPSNSGVFIPCDAGYQCPAGSLKQLICPRNTFSLPDSSSCTPCPSGQFNKNEGSSFCQTCPTSKWNAEGWYCMSEIEKGLFITGWIVTSFSAILSLWKIINFVKERFAKMRENGVPKSFRNFIFLDKVLKSTKLTEMNITSENDDQKPMIQKDDAINELREIVKQLQKEVFLLKNK